MTDENYFVGWSGHLQRITKLHNILNIISNGGCIQRQDFTTNSQWFWSQFGPI